MNSLQFRARLIDPARSLAEQKTQAFFSKLSDAHNWADKQLMSAPINSYVEFWKTEQLLIEVKQKTA